VATHQVTTPPNHRRKLLHTKRFRARKKGVYKTTVQRSGLAKQNNGGKERIRERRKYKGGENVLETKRADFTYLFNVFPFLGSGGFPENMHSEIWPGLAAEGNFIRHIRTFQQGRLRGKTVTQAGGLVGPNRGSWGGSQLGDSQHRCDLSRPGIGYSRQKKNYKKRKGFL